MSLKLFIKDCALALFCGLLERSNLSNCSLTSANSLWNLANCFWLNWPSAISTKSEKAAVFVLAAPVTPAISFKLKPKGLFLL